MQHTPGPWNVNTGSGFCYVDSESLSICSLSNMDGDDTQRLANARIIAAAPDSHAVCVMLDEFDDEMGSPAWNALKAAARKALTKAKVT